jgi:predicted transcriptional regulator
MKFNLEEGMVYMVQESSPSLSLEALRDLLNVGYSALLLSRTSKKDIGKLIEGDFKYKWLSEKQGENTLAPKLKNIENIIEDQPRRKIILMDRLDYLVSKHGFKKVLTFIQHLREIAVIANHVIILSIDPSVLKKKELRLLEKETAEIEQLLKPRLREDLLEVLSYVYKQNLIGTKPSLTKIGQELSLSKPTIRKRIRELISTGYIREYLKGRNKAIETTDRGKLIFTR